MSFLRYAPVFAALTFSAGTLLAGVAQAAPANAMAPATAAKPAMTPGKPAMASAKPASAMRAAPRHAAATPTGRMVTTKTSTGKAITYNCSLAGNATKKACK